MVKVLTVPRIAPGTPVDMRRHSGKQWFEHTRRLANGSQNRNRVIAYDTFAGLRGERIPPHVVDGREMVDAVAAWALPGALSSIPADILVTMIGALMCECQVCTSDHREFLVVEMNFAPSGHNAGKLYY